MKMRSPSRWNVCAGCMALGAVALLALAAATSEKRAAGLGTIDLDHHDHDSRVGAFEFNVVKRGSTITGRFEYAAEDHGARPASGAYPHIVVRVEEIEEVSFGAHRVTFSGEGWLQGDTVQVVVIAEDGATEDDHDSLRIICKDGSGVVYEGHGPVVNGSLDVE